jgi:hypothetical protein
VAYADTEVQQNICTLCMCACMHVSCGHVCVCVCMYVCMYVCMPCLTLEYLQDIEKMRVQSHRSVLLTGIPKEYARETDLAQVHDFFVCESVSLSLCKTQTLDTRCVRVVIASWYVNCTGTENNYETL